MKYLEGLAPFAEEVADWPSARVRMRGYLTDRPVPAFGSSRAVVFRDREVLVLHNLHGEHLLPGGRREGDETPEQTVRREVLEESGWALGPLRLFAVLHLHFFGPPTAEHVGPHPDLLWPIHRAEALQHHPEAMVPDGYELGAAFEPVASVLARSWSPMDEGLLRAAVALGPDALRPRSCEAEGL